MSSYDNFVGSTNNAAIGSGLAKFSDDSIIYNSFSGTDITALLILPNEEAPLALGELQTISYSIHRENTPVRTLGHTNVRGFVKGPRTIAGSMIWYQFNQYAFYRLRQYHAQANMGLYTLGDMLPPFDIVLSFSNEYGAFAKMSLFGISLVDEGGTMSIDDLVTEQTWTYMARAIQPLTSYVPHDFENIELIPGRGTITRPSLNFGIRP